VQLESRAIWDWLLHAEGIAREVRNSTVANWNEAHMFDCLSWGHSAAQRNDPLFDHLVGRDNEAPRYRKVGCLACSNVDDEIILDP
jgi:hypothetical protein